METFIYISCLVLGGALGVAGDWLFWQVRFREADERVREESKKVGQAFNAQIEEKDRQLAAIKAELDGLRETSQAELVAAKEEIAVLENRLSAEAQRLNESQELNKKLPVLEKALSDRQAALAQMQAEKEELAGAIDALQAKVAQERKAFEEGLVYVQGSHYLPASVVRNLTGSPDEAASVDESEENL